MATKKASTEYTQKETRKKSKCATIKNQLDTKEGNKGGNEGQKSCRKHAENKWQHGRSESFIISNRFQCEQIKLTARHRLAEWIKKPRSKCMLSTETYFSSKDTYRLKVERWKKTLHTNQKRVIKRGLRYLY